MGVGEHFKQGGKEPGLWLQRREEGSGEAGQERKQRAGLVRRAWPVRQAGTVRGHLSGGGGNGGRMDTLSSLEAHRWTQ